MTKYTDMIKSKNGVGKPLSFKSEKDRALYINFLMARASQGDEAKRLELVDELRPYIEKTAAKHLGGDTSDIATQKITDVIIDHLLSEENYKRKFNPTSRWKHLRYAIYNNIRGIEKPTNIAPALPRSTEEAGNRIYQQILSIMAEQPMGQTR